MHRVRVRRAALVTVAALLLTITPAVPSFAASHFSPSPGDTSTGSGVYFAAAWTSVHAGIQEAMADAFGQDSVTVEVQMGDDGTLQGPPPDPDEQAHMLLIFTCESTDAATGVITWGTTVWSFPQHNWLVYTVSDPVDTIAVCPSHSGETVQVEHLALVLHTWSDLLGSESDDMTPVMQVGVDICPAASGQTDRTCQSGGSSGGGIFSLTFGAPAHGVDSDGNEWDYLPITYDTSGCDHDADHALVGVNDPSYGETGFYLWSYDGIGFDGPPEDITPGSGSFDADLSLGQFPNPHGYNAPLNNGIYGTLNFWVTCWYYDGDYPDDGAPGTPPSDCADGYSPHSYFDPVASPIIAADDDGYDGWVCAEDPAYQTVYDGDAATQQPPDPCAFNANSSFWEGNICETVVQLQHANNQLSKIDQDLQDLATTGGGVTTTTDTSGCGSGFITSLVCLAKDIADAIGSLGTLFVSLFVPTGSTVTALGSLGTTFSSVPPGSLVVGSFGAVDTLSTSLASSGCADPPGLDFSTVSGPASQLAPVDMPSMCNGATPFGNGTTMYRAIYDLVSVLIWVSAAFGLWGMASSAFGGKH